MTETHAARFRMAVVNPAISIIFPFLFLLTLGLAVNGAVLAALGPSASPIRIFTPGFFILLLITQIEESLGAFLTRRERAGLLVRVRELILLLVAEYIVLALFSSGAIHTRIIPDVLKIVRIITLAVGWILSAHIHTKLGNFESFYRIRADHEGEALHHAVRQSSSVVGEARESLMSVRRTANVYLVVIAVVLVMLWLFGIAPGVTPFVAFCFFGVGYVATRSSVHIFIDEIDYAGEGLRLSFSPIRRRILVAVAIGGTALVFAVLLAANRSILPFSLIVNFLNWIESLFHHVPARTIPASPPHQTTMGNMALLNRFLKLQEHTPPEWLKIMWQVVRIAGLAAIGGGILAFIFGPLLSRNFAAFMRGVHPLRALVKWAVQLYRSLRRGVRTIGKTIGLALAQLRRTTARTGTTLRNMEKRRHIVRPSHKKRAETDRVRQQLLRVIEWGESHGTDYRDSLTTREYAVRLQTYRPSLSKELDLLTSICNEAFYSTRILGDERFRALTTTVELIIESTGSD